MTVKETVEVLDKAATKWGIDRIVQIGLICGVCFLFYDAYKDGRTASRQQLTELQQRLDDATQYVRMTLTETIQKKTEADMALAESLRELTFELKEARRN